VRQCTTCVDGYNLEHGKCTQCDDVNCASCSITDTGKCSACEADYYLSNSACTACGDGKYSAAGSSVASACKSCADSNCLACDGEGLLNCNKCAAGYELSAKSCSACADGTFSTVGSACSACADNNCKTCSGNGAADCTVCLDGYFLDSATNTCSACKQTECLTCNNGEVAQCTVCKKDYILDNGICETTVEELGGGVFSTLISDYTMAGYNSSGGDNNFVYSMAQALGASTRQFKVISKKQGSLIVDFQFYALASDTSSNGASLKALLDAAHSSGSLNIFGTQVLNYGSSVMSLSGCADGYYLDSNSLCQVCPDGCDTCTSGDDKCKKTNVGAIVGGVVGGVALVIIIVVLVVKRKAIKKIISPGNYVKVFSSPNNAQKA